MNRRVIIVLIAGVVLWVPSVGSAQQLQMCVSAVPPNIDARLLTEDVIALLQASPTFRAQCDRIAAALNLRIDIELVHSLAAGRAETTITRFEFGAVRALVRISFGQDYRELIAHEFEHIIEQLDGVNLRWEAEHGRAWLVDTEAFETQRASDAGRRVRREVEPGVHTALANHQSR